MLGNSERPSSEKARGAREGNDGMRGSGRWMDVGGSFGDHRPLPRVYVYLSMRLSCARSHSSSRCFHT